MLAHFYKSKLVFGKSGFPKNYLSAKLKRNVLCLMFCSALDLMSIIKPSFEHGMGI